MSNNNRNNSDKNKVPDFQFEYGIKPSTGKPFKYIYEIREGGLASATYSGNRKANMSIMKLDSKQDLTNEIEYYKKLAKSGKRDCEESARIVREGISTAYVRGLFSNEIREFWETFDMNAQSLFSETEDLKILQQMVAESEKSPNALALKIAVAKAKIKIALAVADTPKESPKMQLVKPVNEATDLINSLYSEWNQVKTDADYKRFAAKLLAVRFGTHKTILLDRQYINRYDFAEDSVLKGEFLKEVDDIQSGKYKI